MDEGSLTVCTWRSEVTIGPDDIVCDEPATPETLEAALLKAEESMAKAGYSYSPLVFGKSRIKPSSPCNWCARPVGITPLGLLRVYVEGEHSRWCENWDLRHTLVGIKSGFYEHTLEA